MTGKLGYEFIPEDDGARIEPADDVADLAGAFAGYALTADLEADHRRELEQEFAPGR